MTTNSLLWIPTAVSILLALWTAASAQFTPTPGSPFPVGEGPRSVAVEDFNGDGRLDLAIANNEEFSVTVLLGNGTGGFTAAPGSPLAQVIGRCPEHSVAAVSVHINGSKHRWLYRFAYSPDTRSTQMEPPPSAPRRRQNWRARPETKSEQTHWRRGNRGGNWYCRSLSAEFIISVAILISGLYGMTTLWRLSNADAKEFVEGYQLAMKDYPSRVEEWNRIKALPTKFTETKQKLIAAK